MRSDKKRWKSWFWYFFLLREDWGTETARRRFRRHSQKKWSIELFSNPMVMNDELAKEREWNSEIWIWCNKSHFGWSWLTPNLIKTPQKPGNLNLTPVGWRQNLWRTWPFHPISIHFTPSSLDQSLSVTSDQINSEIKIWNEIEGWTTLLKNIWQTPRFQEWMAHDVMKKKKKVEKSFWAVIEDASWMDVTDSFRVVESWGFKCLVNHTPSTQEGPVSMWVCQNGWCISASFWKLNLLPPVLL